MLKNFYLFNAYMVVNLTKMYSASVSNDIAQLFQFICLFFMYYTILYVIYYSSTKYRRFSVRNDNDTCLKQLCYVKFH